MATAARLAETETLAMVCSALMPVTRSRTSGIELSAVRLESILYWAQCVRSSLRVPKTVNTDKWPQDKPRLTELGDVLSHRENVVKLNLEWRKSPASRTRLYKLTNLC